jgi:YVTN family beta-propeller protein
VSVIDHGARAVIGTVALGNQPHGHAPSLAGDRIYVTTDGDKGEVVAVDTSNNSIVWRMEIGEEINEPHLTRDGRFLYAPDLLAGRVIVVDVEAAAVVTEIQMLDEQNAVLAALHNTYASYDGRFMYVTAILSQAVARIDTATNTITRLYRLSGDPRPAAITHDDRTMYLQLSALHGFIELDLETGEETRKIEWPEPVELPAGWDEYTGLPTKCHGIGVSPDGSELWAATNMEGAVYVYSLPALEQLARIEVGNWPNWIAFSSDGTTAYVTNSEVFEANGTVSVVDVSSRTVQATLPVGTVPKRIHRIELPER